MIPCAVKIVARMIVHTHVSIERRREFILDEGPGCSHRAVPS